MGFQVLGRACAHASPQKLKVHDRLLRFLQRDAEARTRAGGRTSWACGTLCRRPLPVWARTVPAPARPGVAPLAQDALCRARRACTFERSCAPAFNLAEIRHVRRRQAFLSRARIPRWRRGLVKEVLSATHADQCAIRHIRTCTSMAPLAGIDVRARKFHELPGKLLFSNASRISRRSFFALGLTPVPT